MKIKMFAVSVLLVLLAGMVIQPSRAQHSETLHYGEQGEIRFTASVRVREKALNPGLYQVRHKADGTEHVLLFKELGTGGRDNQAKWVIREVARVRCRVEPTSEKIKRTQVLFRTNAAGEQEVAEVRIAGENVKHLLF